MRLYLKLAWRNIFRNKRRTFIAGIAIGIGLAALIYTDALIAGMTRNMIRSATASFLGEGQIHRAGFRETLEVDRTIVGTDAVMAQLETEPVVEAFTARAMTFAMISSPANVQAVSMVGVRPNSERRLSQIDDAIVEGGYFIDDNPRDIVIGRELAEILEVELGDRIVLTAAQAGTGDLAQEMFRISGVYFFNTPEMDKGMAFVRLDKAQQMLNLDGAVHEIALAFNDDTVPRNRQHPFWSRFSQNGNHALGWVDLVPQLESVLKVSQFSTFIFGIILFSVVALGIVNTLFMSLYERMYEFGVMRAVGTNPFAMGRLVVFEAASLAVISIVLGLLLGLAITYISSQTGIDYGGIEFAGVTFRELLYPELQAQQFILLPLCVFLLTIMVSLYPAVYAARLQPAEAMRKSL